MLNLLKIELIKGFKSKMFLFACTLGVAAYFYSFVNLRGPHIPGADLYHRNVYIEWQFAIVELFLMLAPLLACLPFANSYHLEKSSGYINHILTRSEIKNYITSKFVANASLGGLAIVVPMVTTFIIACFFSPIRFPPPSPENPLPSGPWTNIYYNFPLLFIMLRYILIGFIFGAAYASFGLATSRWAKNSYVIVVTPFLYFLIANFIFGNLWLEEWTPPVALSPHMVNYSTITSIFLPLASMLLLSFGVWILTSKREVIE